MKLDLKILQPFPPQERYLIGVSGGRDSVALLHILVQAGYKRLVVCHLNHQLRGRSAAADARFVEKMSGAYHLKCELGETDVRSLANKTKISIETAARVARFAFFVAVARRKKCRTIFFAHHADDLVETALWNLFRGAGPGGIAALREVSVHRIGKTGLTIVRPLLGVWREEIDAYVQEHRLQFREDASNARLDARRNRIRHRILPQIEKELGREVRKTIWRAAQIWREEEALLDSLVPDFARPELEVVSLRKLHLALQRRSILQWLRANKVQNVGFDLVEKIRALIQSESEVAKVNLPKNRHVRRRGGQLFLEGPGQALTRRGKS